MTILFRDVPVVFLSYRESNADSNYAHLKEMVPEALRVHGVKGFDTAHKRASEKALELARARDIDLPFFITVDGDNQTLSDFWFLTIEQMQEQAHYLSDKTEYVLSWNSYNPITGLAYGNGGLKLWSHEFVRNMNTHESTDEDVVDFCWRPGYFQLSHIFSTTHVNGSEKQAFTAGFREGVKMPLVAGKSQGSVYETKSTAYLTNLERLITWMSVGSHEPHGEWSILGALCGFVHCHIRKDYPLVDVSNIMKVHKFFDQLYSTTVAKTVIYMIKELRDEVERMTDMHIPILGSKQSAFVVQRTLPVMNSNPFELEKWPPRFGVKR